MSLSPVRNPKLMTLPSTHHHFCSAQQKALLHPISWVQPLPCHTTHLVGNSPKHTQVLCPLKIQQQKRVRRWDLGQLCGEGQWLTGISWKASHSILVWARHTVLLTLLTLYWSFYMQFLCCILTLRVITTELHSCAPLLQHYNKLCFSWVSWTLHPLEWSLLSNKTVFWWTS